MVRRVGRGRVQNRKEVDRSMASAAPSTHPRRRLQSKYNLRTCASLSRLLSEQTNAGPTYMMCLKLMYQINTAGMYVGKLLVFVEGKLSFLLVCTPSTCVCVCVCVSSHLFWTSNLWTYQPRSHRNKIGRARERGETWAVGEGEIVNGLRGR